MCITSSTAIRSRSYRKFSASPWLGQPSRIPREPLGITRQRKTPSSTAIPSRSYRKFSKEGLNSRDAVGQPSRISKEDLRVHKAAPDKQVAQPSLRRSEPRRAAATTYTRSSCAAASLAEATRSLAELTYTLDFCQIFIVNEKQT